MLVTSKGDYEHKLEWDESNHDELLEEKLSSYKNG